MTLLEATYLALCLKSSQRTPLGFRFLLELMLCLDLTSIQDEADSSRECQETGKDFTALADNTSRGCTFIIPVEFLKRT